jgi:DNA repair protein RadA/Sms
MHGEGLKIVVNPSDLLLTQRDEDVSGISIGATVEGIRPLLIEVQSLVGPATFGNPQRSTTGFDFKRLNMLLAVLEKRAGFRLSSQDVFLNITGGIKVDDPALDLSVCMAIISSYQEITIPRNTCFAAEIGLSGELRTVSRIDNRIMEAEKQGFQRIVISNYNKRNLNKKKSPIEILTCQRIDQVIQEVLGGK